MKITAGNVCAAGAVAAVVWAAHSVAAAPASPVLASAISGVQPVAVAAYIEAAAAAPPGCKITPSLIAAIGAVESGHGTFGDSQPDPATGKVNPPIRGPRLDGIEFAEIRDTDDGQLDGDPIYDRAVGPMQFIPSTWAHYADPSDDPQNLFDAAKNTGRLLCAVAEAEGRPVTDPAVERAAILSYNYSDDYVRTVQQFKADFDQLGLSQVGEPGRGYGEITPGAVAAKLGEEGRRRWQQLGDAIDRTDANRVRPVFDAADPVARLVWNTLDSTPGDAVIRDNAATAAPGGGLATVAGITVDTSLAAPLQQLLDDAAADGIILTGSGWRSPAEQIELRRQNCGTSDYAMYEMPSGQCSPPTAIPGTSLHESGLAIDFRDGNGVSLNSESPGFLWLQQHAARYGLHNLPSEPWHWSTTGS